MRFIITLSVLVFTSIVQAKLNVVATTSDIKAIVEVVGGNDVSVTSIAKGSQDPHYVEAKPSFMVKMRDADLVVANGLALEVGWLPTLLRGARNPKVLPGSSGFLELGSLIDPLDKPVGAVTRAMGDVHPEGNPHFTLDPIRVGALALKLSDKLGELDSNNKANFLARATAFNTSIAKKVESWQARIKKSGVTSIVTYHPSLNYFVSRFNLKVPIYIESKPGIPPSAQHILSVIQTLKNEKIKLILVDNFFDTKVAERVIKEVPGAKVISVGIAVDSAADLKSLEDVTEQLVKALEGAK
jgi:zinc/manganese transport system substrate-binding protein